MKNKITDIVCTAFIMILFAVVVVMNIFQAERPTVSVSEKRELAKFPELTIESLADGSFFQGITMFVSDTFVGREKLVNLSKQMETLKGFDYSLGENDTFVLLNPTGQNNDDNSGISDKIKDALDKLGEGETTSDTSKETTNDSAVTPVNPVEVGRVVKEAGTEILENGSIHEITADIVEGESLLSLGLSKNDIKLTIGSGATLKAAPKTIKGTGADVTWSVDDTGVITISPSPDGGISIKTVTVGTALITCESSSGEKSTCTVTVEELQFTNNEDPDANADFYPNGLFLYGDAVYTQAWYDESYAKTYAQAAQYYKALFGTNTRVNVVVAPLSAMVIDNPEVTAQITDQKWMFDSMKTIMGDTVNFVDTYSEFYAHRKEYIFFKSDHHWTDRGAYYAYSAFAKSVGFEPTPLGDFGYDVISETYQGSMYQYTLDERVKNILDTVEVYEPTKPHTMTVTTQYGGTQTFDTSIIKEKSNYLAFIDGDNPFTVINVPSNPQDRSVLVLKDSFGNAFVPFLCEHYGNIYVVDTRYYSLNVYEQFKDYGLTDIIFLNNLQAAISAAWPTMYMRAVGVN